MESIGQALRRAREEKGITLHEVKSALRISSSYLDALESGDFGKLPAPAYARAFLRQYARYLGLDAEALLEEYGKHQPKDEPAGPSVGWTSAPQVQSRWGSRLASVLVACALALGVFGLFYEYRAFQAGKKEVETAAATGAAPGAAGDSAAVDALAPRGARPRESGAGEAGMGGQPLPASRADAAAPPIESAAQGHGVVAVVTARQPCWVRITADGKVTYRGTLQPGDERTWKAVTVLEIVAGNAGGIDLAVNGERLDALGRPGQVIRRRFEVSPNSQVAQRPV